MRHTSPSFGGTARPYASSAMPRHGNASCTVPAAVGIGPAVHHAIHIDGRLQRRKVPVQEPPAFAARVNVSAHAVEHHGALRGRVELRPPIVRRLRPVSVLPDPERLVRRIQRVDLKLVVRILAASGAADENLHVVFFPDLRIALRHGAPDIRLFHPKAESTDSRRPRAARRGYRTTPARRSRYPRMASTWAPVASSLRPACRPQRWGRRRGSMCSGRLQIQGREEALHDATISSMDAKVLVVIALTLPLCAQVKLTQQGKDRISVEIDGKTFTDFYIGPETAKPYLHPLRTADDETMDQYNPLVFISF